VSTVRNQRRAAGGVKGGVFSEGPNNRNGRIIEGKKFPGVEKGTLTRGEGYKCCSPPKKCGEKNVLGGGRSLVQKKGGFRQPELAVRGGGPVLPLTRGGYKPWRAPRDSSFSRGPSASVTNMVFRAGDPKKTGDVYWVWPPTTKGSEPEGGKRNERPGLEKVSGPFSTTFSGRGSTSPRKRVGDDENLITQADF